MTVEHVEPGWRGDAARAIRGRNRPKISESSVGACWACNHERGDMPLLMFLWLRQQSRRRDDGGATVRVLRVRKARNHAKSRHPGAAEYRVERVSRKEPAPPLRVSIGDRLKWQGESSAGVAKLLASRD